jgi:hypothetical protein
MIDVPIRKLIILQKDLDLLIHLMPDIITANASNNRQQTKAQTAQSSHPQGMDIRLLQCRTRSFDNLRRDAWDFGERCGAERKGFEECG